MEAFLTWVVAFPAPEAGQLRQCPETVAWVLVKAKTTMVVGEVALGC